MATQQLALFAATLSGGELTMCESVQRARGVSYEDWMKVAVTMHQPKLRDDLTRDENARRASRVIRATRLPPVAGGAEMPVRAAADLRMRLLAPRLHRRARIQICPVRFTGDLS
ncbi:hypothetical protein QMZ05_08965 [Bradyrhizobium sp. INPA03-11B]|uniref:hypothetical protein n=1 Tax=Bradyrhizobium sp. INPA03-11B TaxID=418598 RepID=UPI00338D67FB